MPDPTALQLYAEQVRRLQVNPRGGGAFSPHKPCMLLAVLDMAHAGLLTKNQIAYTPALLERYMRFFDAAKAPGDHANPYFPFFHLRGSLRGGAPSFWHLNPLPGRESILEAMDSARSHAHITQNVAYASLDPELHALLQDPANCDYLSAVLVKAWFDRTPQDMAGLLQRSAAISQYERTLRTQPASALTQQAALPASVRSPAFRRVVIQAYDYRCAATGERIITPAGEALVEAAHIHPFSESADDDPRNGLALSRDMHWAMDRNLIAPGPDYKWHVSKVLDPRIPDFRRLCSLDGCAILLPTETRLTPKRESLEWRLERLRDPDWSAPPEGTGN